MLILYTAYLPSLRDPLALNYSDIVIDCDLVLEAYHYNRTLANYIRLYWLEYLNPFIKYIRQDYRLFNRVLSELAAF